MDAAEFRESLKRSAPPAGLSTACVALWWDGKGRWQEAQETAQRDEGPEGAWVHAYLHRKEGDLTNAKYWYARADRATGEGDLQREWDAIVTSLLRSRDQA